MNFDLDDPLGDLLSEESHESKDSFFEKGNKKNDSRNHKDIGTNKSATAASKIDNLFGIKMDKTKSQPKSSLDAHQRPNTLTTQQSASITNDSSQTPFKAVSLSSSITTPKKGATLKKEITFEDNDDLSLDLGFDPKKPKSAVKKISILDDFLGTSEPKKTLMQKTPPKINQQLQDTLRSTRLSRQSSSEKHDNNTNEINSSSPNYVTSTSRSSASFKRESSLHDPLGLYLPTAAPETKIDTKPTQKISQISDWLGISGTSQSKNSEPQLSVPVPNSSFEQPQGVSQELQSSTTVLSSYPIQNLAETFKPNINEKAQILATTTKETENALSSMKQQELQLIIATQIKNQEVALMEMQKRQQEMLHKQETNFNELLQKQIHRQSSLELNIKRQQEQINSHIQVLMSQPMSEINNFQDAEWPIITKEKENDRISEKIVLQSEIKILELEKLRLEDLVNNIKTNHELELNLMKQSHKYIWLC